MAKKGKEFIFPDNVNSTYGAFLGLSLKELATYVLPISVFGLVLLAIPPYNLWLLGVKLIIILLLLTLAFALISAKPVKHRQNITMQDYLTHKKSYRFRQKRFYIKKRKPID